MKWTTIFAITSIVVLALFKGFEVHENNKYRMKLIDAVTNMNIKDDRQAAKSKSMLSNQAPQVGAVHFKVPGQRGNVPVHAD